jgi:DNA-binding GntR family transcriptional regulator
VKGSLEESTRGATGGVSSEVDAAKDLLRAINADDPRAVSLALRRHYEACMASDDEDDEGENDESDDHGEYPSSKGE